MKEQRKSPTNMLTKKLQKPETKRLTRRDTLSLSEQLKNIKFI